MCPQYPFLGAYIEQYSNGNIFPVRQFFTCAFFILLMTLGLFTAIALIRVNAVFRPFSFVWSTRRSKYIVIAISFASFTYASLSINLHLRMYFENGEMIAGSITSIQILLCLLLMTISYIAIAVKLYRHAKHINKYSATADKTKKIKQGKHSRQPSKPDQQRKKTSNLTESAHKEIEVSTISDNNDAKNIGTTSNAAMETSKVYRQTNYNRKTHAREKSPTHLKTLKMFFVVTVIFLTSNIPYILISERLTNIFYIAYIPFMTHNSNLIVCIVFNTEFRNDALDIWKRIQSYFQQ